MKRSVTAILAASAALGSPALAHAGPHDELATSELVRHVFTHPLHLAPFAIVLLALAAIGAWRVAQSVRGEDGA